MNFFFQAEDGIRDLTVTGVQTCALPILPTAASNVNRTLIILAAPWARQPTNFLRSPAYSRSEERRVGKECRSRWSLYHEKKISQNEADRHAEAQQDAGYRPIHMSGHTCQ